MNSFHRLKLATVLVALAAASGAEAQGAEPQLTPIVASVMSTPWPVRSCGGDRHFVYELNLANPTGGDAVLRKIEIVDANTNKVLSTVGEAELKKRLSIGGQRGEESNTLKAGQFGVAFLHLRLDGTLPPPRRLTHRIEGFFAKPGRDFTTTAGETRVLPGFPVVIGAPLAGKGFIAGDGCCDSIRHVRALLPIDGGFSLAQRFAIDWEQADQNNRLVTGDPKVLTNYVIFGKEVYAVANGTVVASRNDLPEHVPGALPANISLDEADGNFVVLDIGRGAYVLYAHMQPGSVRVKAGDRVRRGAPLGRVGNTGNSQAPHLHLHVMDGPSPLKANGIPYVFERFTLTAVDEAGTEDFDKAEATGSPLTLTPVSPEKLCRNTLPLDLSVVTFVRGR